MRDRSTNEAPTFGEDERPVGRASEHKEISAGAIRADERKACVDLVRAAGCLCHGVFLARYPAYPDDYIPRGTERGGPHFAECPIALADAIERGEKGAP